MVLFACFAVVSCRNGGCNPAALPTTAATQVTVNGLVYSLELDSNGQARVQITTAKAWSLPSGKLMATNGDLSAAVRDFGGCDLLD